VVITQYHGLKLRLGRLGEPLRTTRFFAPRRLIRDRIQALTVLASSQAPRRLATAALRAHMIA
jgi:hypothetical protein